MSQAEPSRTAGARPPHARLGSLLAAVSARASDLVTLVDAAPEAVVAFDGNRRILHANGGAERLFGYEPGALDGQRTDALLPERLRQPDAPPMAPTPDLMTVELPGLRRDGTELSVEWTFGSVSLGTVQLFVMMVADRGALDRDIEALRASEERFRLLVDEAHDYAIFMLDTEGRVSSWNTGAERVKGWRRDEIIGQSYDAFFTAEDRDKGLPARLLAQAAGEGRLETTGWRMRKDGSRFYANAHLSALRAPTGELSGFAKITRDLTQQRQAEELELRLVVERAHREAAQLAAERVSKSEERLRRLQGVTAALSGASRPLDVANVILDQSMGELGACAAAVYALSATGDSIELLSQRGHPAEALAGFESLALELRSPLTDAAREKAALFYESLEACSAEFPSLRDAIASGGFEASVALPLVAHGARRGVLGLRFRQPRTFDASDRAMLLTLGELCAQALERARLFGLEVEARAEAEKANRSKDEFLAMLGHELRNPLAPIATALALMRLHDGSAFVKERAVIERQLTHVTHLVDDLLDVSRITRGLLTLKKERTELATVVARAVELTSTLLEQRRHHLVVSVPRRGLAVVCDPTRLAQVVTNFLANSARYTEPGGHIEVAAVLRRDRIVLTVRDDGVGIEPRMLPRVFEIFAQERQSADRAQGGLGLGLAIVKSLVAMHEGSVAAHSEGRGRGSTFTVELPAAGSVEVLEPDESARTVRRVPAGCRVLVVDDNDDGAELLAAWLSGVGYETHLANDGAQALERAARWAPDIVLLDLGLPVMDGFEVARRLKAQCAAGAAPSVVAITGYGQAKDRERTRRAGFSGHIVKPIDFKALSALLDTLSTREAANPSP
jgi:PAS domain S-box-containing protein